MRAISVCSVPAPSYLLQRGEYLALRIGTNSNLVHECFRYSYAKPTQ